MFFLPSMSLHLQHLPDVCLCQIAGSHLTISRLGERRCCFLLDGTPVALCMSPEALRRVATHIHVLLLCAHAFCMAGHAALAATNGSRQIPLAGLQVCLGAGIGIARPQTVAWLSSDLFTYLLGFLMLSMGLTLTFDDFKKVGQGSLAAVCMCGLQQPAAC